MEFEKTGNKKCIQEFLAKESMICIVMVKSGFLKMSGCTLSLDGIFKEIHRKVPSIAVLPNNRVDIQSTNFKGDTTNDTYTTGVLILKSDGIVSKCSFAHHKSGAIMVDMNPQNKILIIENNIVSAETAGIYVQGKSSIPIIKGNRIKYCRASAIITSMDVDSYVGPKSA